MTANDFAGSGRLVTIKEVQERTGLTASTIRKAMRERKFPFYKLGWSVRYKMTEVEAWVNSQRVEKSA